MLQAKDIQKKAERKYANFLRAVARQEAFFPLDITGNKGKSKMPLEQLFPALQNLLKHSKQVRGFGYQVELKSVQSRHAGKMSLPKRIYFENAEDFVQFLGKTTEVAQFQRQLQYTNTHLPQLFDFVAEHPLKLIKNLDIWEDILKVVTYFLAYPKPMCYLRELPIEIHTKFIEQNKGIISEVLDVVLPTSDYFSEERQFEKRYGLRYDEPLLRLRALAEDSFPGLPAFLRDLALPISQVQQLHIASQSVFIIENKQTFLAFPQQANSIAIWGKGFAVELLKNIACLQNKTLYFWGDLDVQGFQMLHQLRTNFPQTRAFLMDKACYQDFQQYATAGTSSKVEVLAQLTSAEQDLLNQLRTKPSKSRLEQEHISQGYLLQALANL